MSQLADLTEVVQRQPLSDWQRAFLFYDLLQALNWDIDGINDAEDALVYLTIEGRG